MKQVLSFLLFLFITFISNTLSAKNAHINNQSFSMENDQIVITYNLSDGKKFNVSLKISIDGGDSYSIIPNAITGDVGTNISPGEKKIVWTPEKDGINLQKDKLLFYLEATPSDFIKMVFIKGGCYNMGDTFSEGWGEEIPVHKVCLDDFFLSEHEVTQEQWIEVMKKSPSHFKKCGAGCPVENISWFDVQYFINTLNESMKLNYRLPTEAEWEFAAREGGKNIRFGTGNDILSSREANFDSRGFAKEKYSEVGEFRDKTLPVKTFPPSKTGLYDMAGNVWELLSDRFSKDYYGKSTVYNPKGPAMGSFVIIRGGGWNDKAKSLRATRRSRVYPDFKSNDIGFRLAKSP